MIVAAVAGLITFLFTGLLTIAGVGAAFILIPVFIALGIEVHVAMATALLLNAVAMIFASYRFGKNGLIIWKVAFPILFAAAIFSPFGAYVSRGMNREGLLWLFTGFLLFAAGMMLFHKSKPGATDKSNHKLTFYGISIGCFAGFSGGLLGVGGGNIIVPALVWLGMDPKKASATTSFIVIFSSLTGFIGHASLGHIHISLLGFTFVGSALGALAGSWMMTDKLKKEQVKYIIGIVLLGIAVKMIWGLLF